MNHYPVTPCPKNIRSPWNLVAIRKVDLYAESAIANGASMYSYACSAVKYISSSTVENSH